MQARYYDPAIGRFLSNDPVGFTAGGIEYFNRYAYVANDPVNLIDPLGLCAYDVDGNAVSGLCAIDGAGSDTQDFIDGQIADSDSIAGDVDKNLNEEGGIVWVFSGDSGEAVYDSGNQVGTIEFGPETAELEYDDGVIDPSGVVPSDESFEHEVTHISDFLAGSVSGSGTVDSSGKYVGPSEASAINQTNKYRRAKGRGYQRTGAEYE